MLEEIGAWMAINGDGIYGSKAWVRLGEGDIVDGKLRVAPNGKLGRRHADFRFGARDFRFTMGKDGALYAFCMTVPAPGTELKIVSLGTGAGLLSTPIRSVKLLGSGATLEWRQRTDGLTITCPSELPFKTALGFRIG